MNSAKRSMLCLDKDKENLELLTYFFEREGFEVKTCTCFKDYFLQFRRQQFSAVVLENISEDITSAEICREIRVYAPNLPIVFCSVEARETEITKAMKAGGNMYFVKPLEFDKVVNSVKELINYNQLNHQLNTVFI